MVNVVGDVSAIEILDSRGRPTLQVSICLTDGSVGFAGVPSGASTGSGEAVELRDGDPLRYAGQGVTHAAANVNEIRDRLVGESFASLGGLDALLISLDGAPNKGRLGANAIVGVSMAAARAMAHAAGEPLHRWLTPDRAVRRLPVPHFNVVNGGVHAANSLDFQEFMIAPIGAPTLREAVRAGAEVYAALRSRLRDLGHATGLGDEGGFAPQSPHPTRSLSFSSPRSKPPAMSPDREGSRSPSTRRQPSSVGTVATSSPARH